ncbi:transmembrane protein, putative (macronuclear) [Tetrahymena thermophila SB210]|uniref:Transmembrane protein, putative n=1 Tax=Tetrahymena thermophila (strain SB210) TaxID=312017 RepID=I7MFE0_TETTS|nr:transmembrane protein, putative [Tetrahymena thermophila SB210]EAR99680.3 transmembrane protein, putative [Tetrahymena thermophila SB210]|eukprot:XP_001019925.3 transmembrane protein, putative [Tetrahymena thermophila SB210]
MRIIYKILLLSLLLIVTKSVFIRKQTIKSDDVLGQVVIVEEYNTQDQANLDTYIQQNAQFIEEELDYASQLANMMLNSLENELVDDKLIKNGGPVFNALENLKGVVNEMQQAEHDYLEEVKHEREETEQTLSELEKQVKEDSNKLQTKKKDKKPKLSTIQTPREQYKQEKKLQNPNLVQKLYQEGQKLNQFNDTVNKKHDNLNKLLDDIQQIIQRQEERDEVNDLITDYGKVDQQQINDWIQDDYDSQEETEEQINITQPKNMDQSTKSQQEVNSKSQNFNSTPEKAKKEDLKIGLGPQISMKQTTSYKPLYKDPSIIIGVISFLLLLGGLGYYFIRSKMNLRKSSSTILEQAGEISLSQGKYEKVKII